MSQVVAAVRPRAQSNEAEGHPPVSAASRLADFGLIVAFLSLTFLLGVFPLRDTDFWWHLKAGDWIRQNGEVPRVDLFTFGAEGRAWVDLHWVFQVLLSWGFAHGGVVTLNLAKCAITTLALFFLITARRREWPVWAGLLAWLPALLVLNGRMYIRPETLSLLYLSIVLAILFRWDRMPWLGFALPVVQVCWVNTQGLFLLEPILIAFALLDALIRPGAFLKERRGWWRIVGAATALTGVACLVNPYGLEGALYPIQLAGTMSNDVFKTSIGELKPLLTFMNEVGLDSLPLKLHLLTFGLGLLSFVLPSIWRIGVAVADRGSAPAEPPKGKKKRGKSKGTEAPSAPDTHWRFSPFRALLFASFSALSLAATRNSHQFAAVVGTVTAWNFAEWAGAIRARRLRLDPTSRPPRAWPKLATFAVIALTFAAVASGRYYAWSGEGRTVGIGEEPLWFPHEAVKFAGGPGMPDRLVGIHNGHPALYEYYWAPAKKPYQDARLEVIGPELYQKYLDLSAKLAKDTPGWLDELERMGRPAVLIDNLDQGNAALSATLLRSRRYRCVWFDPIVSLFVHDSYPAAREHAVDFAARHFGVQADTTPDDPATLAVSSRSLRFVGTQCLSRAGGAAQAQAMFLLGLDEARKLRAVEPSGLDGWKQAGLIEYVRGVILSEQAIPRYRMPFDPVFDLSAASATYALRRALAIDPEDGIVLYLLAQSFEKRGMDEPAEPLLEAFTRQPNKNLSQQREKARSLDQLAALRARLGPSPATKWANLGELDRVVAKLMATGRPTTLAEVMEAAYRPEARPWEWADRLAVIELHLGEPAKARAAWIASTGSAPVATRLARIAASYLVEEDFEAARKSYREAIAADAGSFEAHYGLAVLERDAGRALAAVDEARLAERLATTDHAREAARAIVAAAAPYTRPPSGVGAHNTSAPEKETTR